MQALSPLALRAGQTPPIRCVFSSLVAGDKALQCTHQGFPAAQTPWVDGKVTDCRQLSVGHSKQRREIPAIVAVLQASLQVARATVLPENFTHTSCRTAWSVARDTYRELPSGSTVGPVALSYLVPSCTL